MHVLAECRVSQVTETWGARCTVKNGGEMREKRESPRVSTYLQYYYGYIYSRSSYDSSYYG